MYLPFYGLKNRPFNLTPDAGFLFPSKIHREVLDHLLYGINQRKGFIMVTGEVGSGKTTLCRALLNRLDANTEVAFVLNSFLSEIELLKTINEDLGLNAAGETKKELIDVLNAFLLGETEKGKNVVIVIDEAQNLSFPVLEQIRMLSNLETDKEKLLQIVLVGQPELRQKLGLARLRQLNQRISVRHHLVPLTKKEMSGYIYHRLKVAGSKGNIYFTKGAMDELYRCSQGIPRMINVICDQVLLVGYVENSKKITHEMVLKAISEVKGESLEPGKIVSQLRFSFGRAALGFGIILITFAIVVLTGTYTGHFGLNKNDNEMKNEQVGFEAGVLKTAEGKVFQNDAEVEEDEAKVANVSKETSAEDVGFGPEMVSVLSIAMDAGGGNLLGKALPEPIAFSEKETMKIVRHPPKSMLGSGGKEMPYVSTAFSPELEPVVRLLEIWNVDSRKVNLVRRQYRRKNKIDLDDISKTSGMAYVNFLCDLSMLRRIDIPAVLMIRHNEEEESDYAALVRLDNEKAFLFIHNKNVTMELSEVKNIYSGEAIIFCKDSFINETPLQEGMELSVDVRKLQDLLKKYQYFNGNSNGWFTQETKQAVLLFQKDHQLIMNGVVNVPMKLLLYSMQDDPHIPRLSERIQ